MNRSQHWLVVPAAGTGRRMKSSLPKQYLRIRQRFVIDITLSRLLDSRLFDGCVVALHADDHWWTTTDSCQDDRIKTCSGGAARQDSVSAALRVVSQHASPEDWVLVHDVARPCLTMHDLQRLISTLSGHPVGGLLATPVTDTLKRATPDQQVEATVDRHDLWRALTPQMFRLGALQSALSAAAVSGLPVTDEASAIERTGVQPALVEGRADNLKITWPGDLAIAELVLDQLADPARADTGELLP